MVPVIAASQNDQLLLAAALAGVALLFVLAGAISAWAGRRSRRRALGVTERDRLDPAAESTPTE